MWVVLRLIPTKREENGSLFESKILVKSPKPRNEAQRKVNYKNYDSITMSRTYYMKLWASIYYVAQNVGITGILAYPKIAKWLDYTLYLQIFSPNVRLANFRINCMKTVPSWGIIINNGVLANSPLVIDIKIRR